MKKIFNLKKFKAWNTHIFESIQNNFTFYLNSVQSANGRKGLTELKRIKFTFSADNSLNQEGSGFIEDFQLHLEGYEREKQIVTLDDIRPEELFWIGLLFQEIAKDYGITLKQAQKLLK